MDPFIDDRIHTLRNSEDPNERDRGLLMAMTYSLKEEVAAIRREVGDVKVQTTLTNGRVTKLEELATRTNGRIESLEKPAGEIRTICKVIGKAGAIAVACVGLVTGAMAMVSGISKPNPDEIKAIVEQAVKDAKKSTP